MLITPKVKLTSMQRQVALKRALQKQAQQPMAQQQQQAPPMMQEMSPMMQDGMVGEEPSMEEPSPMMEGDATSNEFTSVETQTQSALIANQIWKDGGGSDSVGAQVWNALHKKAGVRHLDSPRDYFISSFIKWQKDPLKYQKRYPREGKLLNQLLTEFERER